VSAIGSGMIDHVSLQVADVARSRAFYEVLLAPLGLHAAYTDGDAVGFANHKRALPSGSCLLPG
jgi:catechol 2,3-dioxygenase-like lactoylglutathione lyase family enzyme